MYCVRTCIHTIIHIFIYVTAYAGMTDDDMATAHHQQSQSDRDITTSPRETETQRSPSSATTPPEGSTTTTPAKETRRHQSSDSRDSGFVESTEETSPGGDRTNRHTNCKDNRSTTETRTLPSSPEETTQVDATKPASTSETTNLRQRAPVLKPSTLNIRVPNCEPRSDFMIRSPSSPTLSTSHSRGDCFKDAASPRSLSPPGSFNFTPTYAKIRHFAQSPVTQFRQMPIAVDPFMSPILASDELLRGLCPVTMVVSLCCILEF